eukprot:scaffold15493_cov51-Cyclotella_meneghiniana.AAC.8
MTSTINLASTCVTVNSAGPSVAVGLSPLGSMEMGCENPSLIVKNTFSSFRHCHSHGARAAFQLTFWRAPHFNSHPLRRFNHGQHRRISVTTIMAYLAPNYAIIIASSSR